jgi:hypothetical protein
VIDPLVAEPIKQLATDAISQLIQYNLAAPQPGGA